MFVIKKMGTSTKRKKHRSKKGKKNKSTKKKSQKQKICNFKNDIIQKQFDELIFNNDNVISIEKDDQENIFVNVNNTYYLKKDKDYFGYGADSYIYKLHDDKNKVSLALKIDRYPWYEKIYGKSREHVISEHLLNSGCNTLNVKFIGNYDNLNYYLMNLAQGDLYELRKKFNRKLSRSEIKFFLTICEEVRKQILCLLKLNPNYVYTDLKLQNILYDCPDSIYKIRVYLGDIASTLPNSDGEYISTFPPYEHRHTGGFLKFNNEDEKSSTLSWAIGMLLLSIISFNAETELYFLFQNFQNANDNEIEKYSNMLSSYYGEGYEKYLSLDPQKRPDIEIPLI